MVYLHLRKGEHVVYKTLKQKAIKNRRDPINTQQYTQIKLFPHTLHNVSAQICKHPETL